MGPLKSELKAAREAFVKGDCADAIKHCRTAIQLNPGSHDAHLCAYVGHPYYWTALCHAMWLVSVPLLARSTASACHYTSHTVSTQQMCGKNSSGAAEAMFVSMRSHCGQDDPQSSPCRGIVVAVHTPLTA